MKIGILGSSGMLGSQVYSFLKASSHDVVGISRDKLDAQYFGVEEIRSVIQGFDYIINAIGIIKPYIHDDNTFEVERAIRVNGLFPHLLADAVKGTKVKIIQIATDCVYDGATGLYAEKSPHNCLDVYGKTKSLGEVNSQNVINLRCSIIGPENKGKLSLLEWFLGQEQGATVTGYTNHLWNGVTTLAFAKICQGIIENQTSFDFVQHVIPADILSKAKMLEVFARVYNRSDLKLVETQTEVAVDRTLSTSFEENNAMLWKNAGYDSIPTIEAMIEEIFGFSNVE